MNICVESSSYLDKGKWYIVLMLCEFKLNETCFWAFPGSFLFSPGWRKYFHNTCVCPSPSLNFYFVLCLSGHIQTHTHMTLDGKILDQRYSGWLAICILTLSPIPDSQLLNEWTSENQAWIITFLSSSCLYWVVQSCPTLFDTMDYSPPGSLSIEFSRTRILEWVIIYFSFFLIRNQICISCISCLDRQFLHHYTTWGALSGGI